MGTGKGHSVLDVINAFENASNKKIEYKIMNRRPGDVAISFANAELARKLFGWKAKYDLQRMCVDSWRWQNHNNKGTK